LASGTHTHEATERTESVPGSERAPEAPVVIEARSVEKRFRIPSHRIDSLKERAVHPFTPVQYRQLRALKGISFDIHRGEFFGIVGRNGSGKSTLLKILASIYRADAGRIRMAGRLAPFIELGVGFNQELTARENIVLNGVMMGLSQREARRRLDAVLEFAELEDFIDLKLKNYSSGMMVRLAFSVMLQSDAEILLIDEVLAVGDAAFQQKCRDVFHEMRDAGRTIVLVTHDMTAVESFCHRALLLHDGEIVHIGDPEQVQRQYLRLNFAGGDGDAAAKGGVVPDVHARLVDSWLENESERAANVELGKPIRFGAVFEALRDLERPTFGFHCYNEDGLEMFVFHRTLLLEEGQPDRLAEGQRARISGTVENPLMPGRYNLKCWVARRRNPGDLALHGIDVLDFVVFGTAPPRGLVSVEADVDAAPERPEGR
jgi:ABC-type polysaccharide/polyol phosphate transport system ATPase subunit